MSTITTNSAMTLQQAHAREGFDDSAAVIGELGDLHDFLDEVPWYPSTHGTYNKQLQATRLGAGTFSRANLAVPSITSGAEELTEPVKMYEADSTVDQRILNGVINAMGVRDSEDALNLEGIVQGWEFALLYNNEGTTPDGFKSLARRRASIVANRTWDASGTGSDLTSMWFFEFSKRGIYLVYPPNAEQGPGIRNQDMGRHKVDVPTGSGQMWAWIRHYEIWAGIVIRDDRALQRYANIESSGSSNILDMATVINIKNQLPSVGRNAVSFVNRTLKGQLDNHAYAKSNAILTVREIENYGPITFAADIPVRMLEQIVNTESELS